MRYDRLSDDVSNTHEGSIDMPKVASNGSGSISPLRLHFRLANAVQALYLMEGKIPLEDAERASLLAAAEGLTSLDVSPSTAMGAMLMAPRPKRTRRSEFSDPSADKMVAQVSEALVRVANNDLDHLDLRSIILAIRKLQGRLSWIQGVHVVDEYC